MAHTDTEQNFRLSIFFFYYCSNIVTPVLLLLPGSVLSLLL